MVVFDIFGWFQEIFRIQLRAILSVADKSVLAVCTIPQRPLSNIVVKLL